MSITKTSNWRVSGAQLARNWRTLARKWRTLNSLRARVNIKARTGAQLAQTAETLDFISLVRQFSYNAGTGASLILFNNVKNIVLVLFFKLAQIFKRCSKFLNAPLVRFDQVSNRSVTHGFGRLRHCASCHPLKGAERTGAPLARAPYALPRAIRGPRLTGAQLEQQEEVQPSEPRIKARHLSKLELALSSPASVLATRPDHLYSRENKTYRLLKKNLSLRP